MIPETKITFKTKIALIVSGLFLFFVLLEAGIYKPKETREAERGPQGVLSGTGQKVNPAGSHSSESDLKNR